MKKPSRMRKTDYPIDMDSSAFEVHSISSDITGTPYRTRQSNNYLVSARYNRRRTIKFKIPEYKSDKLLLTEIKEVQFKNGLNGADEVNNRNDAGQRTGTTAYIGRRMNTTELPPIVKSSTHLINGFTAPRTNTFNKFNFHSKPDRKSVHTNSESSLQGYIVTSNSRTSSSSSQKSRGRVLSAGTDRRTNRQITANITKSGTLPATLKQDNPIMRNGGNTALAHRTISVGGLCRQQKKHSLKDPTTQRTLTKSRSDAQLTLPTRNNNDVNSMRRNESDRSLTDLKNNNVKLKHKPGMRRYASTNGLYVKDDKPNEEDGPDKEVCGDSDTDSDKDQRVLNWIIGVTEVAEPPEEPTIEHVDEPPQRDTAIRIVYDGDS